MDTFMEEFKHLKIQLKELQSATHNFGENNVIGRGGFGNVYKGVISNKEQNIVAIKRLDRKHGQGNTEFWREITMLSRYTHENLVSLVGFCDDGGEKILVYEHAYHGSLDKHLSSTSLTWTQRIKICLDAARGLSYLHDDRGTQQRVLHRDIKSSNILLDQNWMAKVSDMGLSKIGPSNQQHTVIVTDVVGTMGYLDPMYMQTGILSKESDVYSFGVVLFEVLCGRLCFDESNLHILVHTWKQSYNQSKLDEIIFKDIVQQMYSESLKIFSDIAFQSLQDSRLERPTMPDVVEKLKSALEIQEWLAYYEDITRNVVPPLQYKSKAELSILLSSGVLVNHGQTWFSLDDNGKHCEMISIAECLITYASENVESQYSPDFNSRFASGTYSPTWDFRTRVRTQFLSPLTEYMVNLVFKCVHKDKREKHEYMYIQYKFKGNTKVSTVPISEDEWLKAGLCEFTTDQSSIVDLEFIFAGHMGLQEVKVEGIEFVPIKKDAFSEEFQHLTIQLEELQSATDKFSENNIIGRGGFGNVYKGVIPRSDQHFVAIKRLDTKFGPRNIEFWREIMMLSCCTHENLISLVGFCDEGGEKIFVYEHASNRSLDYHLSSTLLTWTQRIKICLDAARGLSYLHDGDGIQLRVLHGDVKSSNILLDENWTAKVSDMGLSKIGPSNQLHTPIVTNVLGTYGYLDPSYPETNILSKESDVYSFGVVLLEVLCGKLCYEVCNGVYKCFVGSWKQIYKQNHLADIIFQDLAQQIYPDAIETFSQIAFQCLHKARDKRPTMRDVVRKLECALLSQDLEKEWLTYEDIAKIAVPPLKYRSKRELRKLFSDGVFLNNGRKRFSIDNYGRHWEMIPIEEKPSIERTFVDKEVQQLYDPHTSRFVENNYEKAVSLKVTSLNVTAEFLSPLTTYTTNLVFKASHVFEDCKDISSNLIVVTLFGEIGNTGFLVSIGNTGYLRPHVAIKREDGTMMVALCQFTSDGGGTVNLEIQLQLKFPSSWEIVLEGIEFRPLEKAEHKVSKHEKLDTQYPFDTYWEQILSNGYKEILKWSDVPIQWTTKKELYVELCKGFLMNNGQEWFFLNKNGKKCSMLSAKACVPISTDTSTIHEKTSRFGEEHLRCPLSLMIGTDINIVWEIRWQVLSPETTYATYLVYRCDSSYEAPVRVIDKNLSPDDLNVNYWYIYLNNPQAPEVGEDTHNPLNSPKLPQERSHNPVNSPKLPQERSDGWMEVQIWEFQTGITPKVIPISFKLKYNKGEYFRLDVLGIEFRPKSGPALH